MRREPGESMESINRIELLRKRDTSLEDDSLQCPVRLLPGEVRLFHGLTVQGEIMLTTYRLFMTYEESFVNFPLRMIEAVECKDSSGLSIVCKDATIASCTLPSSEVCFKWLSRIKQELAPVTRYEDYFAVAFYLYSQDKEKCREGALWNTNSCREPAFKLGEEADRLGFNLKTTWRVSDLNTGYKYCTSYPQEHLLPKTFSDEQLKKAGKFRTQRRFPSAVWRDVNTGAVLLRSSQPEVGLFCNRNEHDEQLLQAVIDACASDGRMLILDARSYTAAIANRAKGGGFEYVEYYANCDIEFMNMPNIHTIRGSFIAVRNLSSAAVDRDSWLAALDATKWLSNLSLLLAAALVVVDSIHRKNRPVLVHCSDGWDRTPQITSLAELILDPYYRTYMGFQILVEREWLSFGHKFADRCGHSHNGADPNEISPVFIQWLDAVYQLTCQFPTAFEFNEAYLMKLLHHSYSCMFGTFLFNNEKARRNETWYNYTASVWSLFNAAKLQFTNRLYSTNGPKVLSVRCHPRDLSLWSAVYSPQTNSTCASNVQEDGTASPGLVRSQSFNEISASIESDLHVAAIAPRNSRRLSDPDLNLGSSLVLSESPMSSASNSQLPATDSTAHLAELCSTVVEQLKYSSRSRNNSNASFRSIEPPTQVRSQDSGQQITRRNFSKYLDIDGHTLTIDPVQQGIQDLAISYEQKLDELNKKLQALTKIRLADSKACTCGPTDLLNLTAEPLDALQSADSSNGHSDTSWENVNPTDTGVTLWMPDHAVSVCSECQVPFRVYRRRHHCRQCGLVFCTKCADVFVPIPDQQLFDPVRVCKHCHINLSKSDNENQRSGEKNECQQEHYNSSEQTTPASPNERKTCDHTIVDTQVLIAAVTEDSSDEIQLQEDTKPLKTNSICSESEMSSHHMDMNGSSDKSPSAHSRSSGLLCQKTCSQESLNTDVVDAHRMRQRTEC